MKIKDLKELMKRVDDEMDVLIPLTPEFDGFFTHPCIKESGVNTLGVDENLGTEEDSFLLVPCGFFEENHGIDPTCN